MSIVQPTEQESLGLIAVALADIARVAARAVIFLGIIAGTLMGIALTR